jgi:toxin-antitoxin system PIN domain toxin
MTPDVNVLLAASRTDHPHHEIARQWLEEALAAAANGAVFTLMPMVIASMLRLATSPKIFQQPTPIADAIAFIDAVLAMPGVELAELGAEWPILRELCVEKSLAGNDLPDAWLAAAVDHQAEHLVSFDRDFRKLLAPPRFTHLKA